MKKLSQKAIKLLQDLISIKSFSSEEIKLLRELDSGLVIIISPLKSKITMFMRLINFFNKNKPTLLLNSHHDTVNPNSAYTRDPFHPQIEDGKLYGLGSNDAGGALVSLIAIFYSLLRSS